MFSALLAAALPASPASADSQDLCSARGGSWIAAAPRVEAHCSISMIDGFTPGEEVASLAYFETAGECVERYMKTTFDTTVSSGNVSPPSEWFNEGGLATYLWPTQSSSCEEVMNVALDTWGIDSTTLLRNMGFVFHANTDTGQPTYESAGSAETRRSLFENYVAGQVYEGRVPSQDGLSAAAKYTRALTMFLASGEGTCQAQSLGLYTELSSTERAYVDAGTTVPVSGDSNDKDKNTYAKLSIASGAGDTATTEQYGYLYRSHNDNNRGGSIGNATDRLSRCSY